MTLCCVCTLQYNSVAIHTGTRFALTAHTSVECGAVIFQVWMHVFKETIEVPFQTTQNLNRLYYEGLRLSLRDVLAFWNVCILFVSAVHVALSSENRHLLITRLCQILNLVNKVTCSLLFLFRQLIILMGQMDPVKSHFDDF